jgi:molybdopterin molybdotransferase
MPATLTIVPDDADAIMTALRQAIASADAVITSGGAWTGDRDLVARILERMGWRQVYHRIRIGPGKAVGFGMLQNKPVFILPGGPPSNLMGFLQIALPGLLTLAGHRPAGLPVRPVCLATDLNGRFDDWTQFVYGEIEDRDNGPVFHSLAWKSRLQSMALATAIVAIPEGEVHLAAGTVVNAQCLD